ncbi:hypothetical protein TNIN_41391 [Trichonephila inaurata madagascariensis]|uniref:Uncharacterized protein n=1 Tax=Trichonephila inaurata madagascariensis TaxID=2747483 RepID=A0A8X7CB55_9ARAC|nr:hypothetical protein TNIN_41391 [Trichonephila inaurata madagascariensis]
MKKGARGKLRKREIKFQKCQKCGFKRRAKPKVTIRGDKAEPSAFWDRRKRNTREPPPGRRCKIFSGTEEIGVEEIPLLSWTAEEKFRGKAHKGQPLGSLTQRKLENTFGEGKEKQKLDTCFSTPKMNILRSDIVWR